MTKFEITEQGLGKNKFTLNVENCNITDVRVLYRIIKNQLDIETKIIEDGGSVHHPLQDGVKNFLENIVAEMQKVERIDDLAYYLIKTR